MKEEFKAALDLLGMLVLDPRTGVLIALLATAAWTDLRTKRIPTALVYGGALFALIYNGLFSPWREAGFLWALEGLGVGLALLLPFYLLRAMGAGDVKLMAMTGAFLGFPGTIFAVLWSVAAGGVLAIGLVLLKGTGKRLLANLPGMFRLASASTMAGARPALTQNAGASAGAMPYGVAIAAGTITYLVLKQLGLIA
jgi:prepilin peptidase CpaA